MKINKDLKNKINKLNKKSREILKKIKEKDELLVISHHDTDGLTSAAIIYRALQYLEKDFKIVIKKKLDDDTIKLIKETQDIILLDLGSNLSKKLIESNPSLIIIDHHPPDEFDENLLNPYEFGLDGGREISGSSLLYSVFSHLPKDFHLLEMGLIGAAGDMQIPFIGYNEYLTLKGIKENKIIVNYDLNIFSKSTKTFYNALRYSFNPYFSVFENEKKLNRFFEQQNINKNICYESLDFEERKKIINELYKYLLLENENKETLNNLISKNYYLTNFKVKDINELASLINTCGRLEKYEEGIKVALNNEKAINKALNWLDEYRKIIVDYINKGTIYNHGAYYLIDGREIIKENMIGVISGILSSKYKDKIIIGISDSKDEIKISTRSFYNRIDLGKLMKNSAGKIKTGGGHYMAAGGSIPKKDISQFFKYLQIELKNNPYLF